MGIPAAALFDFGGRTFTRYDTLRITRLNRGILIELLFEGVVVFKQHEPEVTLDYVGQVVTVTRIMGAQELEINVGEASDKNRISDRKEIVHVQDKPFLHLFRRP